MTQLSPAQKPVDKSLYGGTGSRRVTVRDIAAAKERGEKWPMLTAYDAMTASVFDEAGIPVLLVGDSMGNCHLGYESTVPVTMDEITLLSAAVVRGTKRALVIGDLPFGAYQEGPVQALRSATRLVKEAGVGAVKLEGGERSAEQVELLVSAGIPVMAHVGLTPQSVNAFGGYPVQGRGEEAAQQLLRDAKAVQTPEPSRSSSRRYRPSWPPRSPVRSTSRPSASAPAWTATRRSWCGPTWPA